MNDNKWLTCYDVVRMTGKSADTITYKEKQGLFPKRFKIDKTHNRWHLDEVKEWLKTNPNPHLVPD